MARRKMNKVSEAPKTVAEKKAEYQNNFSEREMSLYANAKKALESLILNDPNGTRATKTLNQYTKEAIRGYLLRPYNQESNIRKAAIYLYYRSQILFRIVNWYATMWDLNCRKVIPEYNLTKSNNASKMKKAYNETLDKLDVYDIQGGLYEVLVKCYLQDVCYSFFLRDDTGAFFYILDPDECTIDSKYYSKDYGFSVDMSKWNTAARQNLIEWMGEPLQSMWREYQSTNQKWVHVPDEYAACFKFRSDESSIISPFAQMLPELANLSDVEDIQSLADEQSILKLLIYPMKTLSGSKSPDQFEVTPDLALEYFYKLVDEMLPSYVSAAPIMGESLDVVDFSTTSADKDIDRVSRSQNQILATGGGGALINANMITSNAALEAWLEAEGRFAITSLMPQIEGFTNRMLNYDLPNHSKVEYFRTTVYTKKKLADDLLKSCQYSFANRIFYNAVLGIKEKQTLAMLEFENNILGLPELMKYPLSSSFTSSGSTEDGYTTEIGQGAPKKDSGSLTDSGDRSRNQ